MESCEFTSPDLNGIRPPRTAQPGGACGVTIEKYGDVKIGDVIEAFIMEQIEV
ncbi:MAG TPA: hypothetical protein VN421_06185 [Pseudoflavonifractor sp.]|nr:hypothetical protein [Pseudoflavonifractor sp.]